MAVLCFAGLLFAQDGFEGRPAIRVDSSAADTKRTELSEEAGIKYECRIQKRRGKYVWTSRQDRELIRANAGDYVYYVSPDGSGYVKVYVGKSPQEFDYMEHVTGELKTLTYWGKRVK